MTSDRDEAADNAMIFAREASQQEGDRVLHDDAWHELARTQPPGFTRAMQDHESERSIAEKNRDIAITLANMWANVAAVQDAGP